MDFAIALLKKYHAVKCSPIYLVMGPNIYKMSHDDGTVPEDVICVCTPGLSVINIIIPLIKPDQSSNNDNAIKSAVTILCS